MFTFYGGEKRLNRPRIPSNQGPGEYISLLFMAMGGMDKWNPPPPRALADYLNLFPDDASSFLRKAEREICEA